MALIKLTFDNNCLIAIEDARDEARPLRRLCTLQGSVTSISVVRVGALEGSKMPGEPKTSTEFDDLLTRINLANVCILNAPGTWGVTRWGEAVWMDEKSIELLDALKNVLFPGFNFRKRENKHWRRNWCDVATMWCHIHSGGDVFVTSDRNFLKQSMQESLRALGACIVLTPDAALAHIEGHQAG